MISLFPLRYRKMVRGLMTRADYFYLLAGEADGVPMGLFEDGHMAGTRAIAKAIIDSGAYSAIGGGETTQFLAQENLLSPPAGGFSFISSGGGAMLEFLAGKQLPGIAALE